MPYDVVEASIAHLATALARGETTSAELVAASLGRIAAYDQAGPRLNAVVVLDPTAMDQAYAGPPPRPPESPSGPSTGSPTPPRTATPCGA